MCRQQQNVRLCAPAHRLWPAAAATLYCDGARRHRADVGNEQRLPSSKSDALPIHPEFVSMNAIKTLTAVAAALVRLPGEE